MSENYIVMPVPLQTIPDKYCKYMFMYYALVKCTLAFSSSSFYEKCID